jgi:hypothetical protein
LNSWPTDWIQKIKEANHAATSEYAAKYWSAIYNFAAKKQSVKIMGRVRIATNVFIFVIFAVLENKKLVRVSLGFCQHLGKIDGLDPENKAGERGQDQGISGEEFSLNIKRGADDVGKNDGNEDENADESFHTGTI